MKVALLIPCHHTINNQWSYIWETPSEKFITEFDTREEAISNKPQGYVCKDDGWNNI